MRRRTGAAWGRSEAAEAFARKISVGRLVAVGVLAVIAALYVGPLQKYLQVRRDLGAQRAQVAALEREHGRLVRARALAAHPRDDRLVRPPVRLGVPRRDADRRPGRSAAAAAGNLMPWRMRRRSRRSSDARPAARRGSPCAARTAGRRSSSRTAYLADGEPFPTTYYLTCPHAVSQIDRLEADGGVDRYERLLRDDAALHASYVAASERQRALRRPAAEMADGGGEPGAGHRRRERATARSSASTPTPRLRSPSRGTRSGCASWPRPRRCSPRIGAARG